MPMSNLQWKWRFVFGQVTSNQQMSEAVVLLALDIDFFLLKNRLAQWRTLTWIVFFFTWEGRKWHIYIYIYYTFKCTVGWVLTKVYRHVTTKTMIQRSLPSPHNVSSCAFIKCLIFLTTPWVLEFTDILYITIVLPL